MQISRLYQDTKELFKIAFPLMISALSLQLMIFVDRIMMSHYKIEAMNAVATSSMLIIGIQFMLTSIGSSSSIFAGQYNGARKYDMAARATWQMIYLSIIACCFFFPLGIYGAKYIVLDNHKAYTLEFFTILMCLIPLQNVIAALNGFFIGIKDTKVITIATVIGNILNIILDYLLIFGVEGYFEAMGATGAALGTAIATIMQAILMFAYFLHSKNNSKYLTRLSKFDLNLLKKCIKLGGPNGMSVFIEMMGWSTLLYLTNKISFNHTTALAITQSIFLFICFALIGLDRAMVAQGSNIIGSNESSRIKDVLKAAIVIHIIITAIFTILIAFSPELITFLFISEEDKNIITYDIISQALIWLIIYYFIDGISWFLSSILKAGADTKTNMIVNGTNVWLFCILPFYAYINFFMPNYEASWQFSCLCAIANIIMFSYRIFFMKWQKNITI